MKIAIRMDDITPDMDWQKFDRFRQLCDACQITPLIGVVPDNQDSLLHIEEPRENFWEKIRQLQQQGWIVAQHGYQHIYRTKKMGCFPLNRLSEFAGRSREEQYQDLKRGKEILESQGIHTDFFMAPAHSYDRNTIKCLKELGFTRLTDGFGPMPYVRWGLSFYPISYRQSTSLKQKDGYTTFVVHANTMKEEDFRRYEMLFSKYQNRFISYQEYVKVPVQKKSPVACMIERCRAFTKFMLVQIRGVQSRLFSGR